MKRVITVVGARPQFVKAAVVSRALANMNDIEEILVHTGQHFDENMSGSFFRDLEIPDPKHNLGIHSVSHGEMTGRMLTEIERLLQSEHPGGLIVYGDTNSTLAGALAASKLHVPIFHIEAGLRSFNRLMPEEINRVLTDHLSSLLFCPTEASVKHLASEGVVSGVHQVGDVMYDATLFAKRRGEKFKSVFGGVDLEVEKYVLATIHRAENTDDSQRLADVFRHIKTEANGRRIVLPLHPRTRQRTESFGLDLSDFVIDDPVGYFEMQNLLAGAELVFTDSGGLQKEAYFHGVPCVTLRDETEWIETIENGWNRLWTVPGYAERKPISEYGTGTSGVEVANIIYEHLESVS